MKPNYITYESVSPERKELFKKDFLKFLEEIDESLTEYDYQLLRFVANHTMEFHGLYEFMLLMRNKFAKYKTYVD